MEVSMENMTLSEAYTRAIEKTERNSRTIGVSFPHVAPGENQCYNQEPASFWTSGFWGGLLWLAYRETRNPRLFELACEIEEALDQPLHEFLSLHHDVGFMWLPTAVTHHKMTGSETSRTRGLLAANLLAGRFNPKGSFIRAWNDEVQADSQGLAIIDCMMNLPLLYWASKELNDPRFRHIATAHADTALRCFVRPDDTVPHIMRFCPETGACLGPVDGQGMSPDSVWSRGQAWAIYGFAISFRETKDMRYLTAAQNIARRFYENLPEDKIPYWDFCSEPQDYYVKDTSAACIAASGMLEIEAVSGERAVKSEFHGMAVSLLDTLIQRHACFDDRSQGIIDMGTVSYFHKRHVNQPIIYGDFYFLEALGKLRGLDGCF